MQTYEVLVEVTLRLAVSDSSHRLIVVELVTQLAEISSHRDNLFHTYACTGTQHLLQCGLQVPKLQPTAQQQIML